MRPSEIFDKCLERVREYQASAASIRSVRFDVEVNGGPTRTGNVTAEYVAEFVLCARRSLKRWPRRIDVFQLYFVEDRTVEEVMKALAIPEGTLKGWSNEVKKVVGSELKRSGLYPPSIYGRKHIRNWKEEING
jgi:DNA-directed RNA polymerase specialized sigma24 family protein